MAWAFFVPNLSSFLKEMFIARLREREREKERARDGLRVYLSFFPPFFLSCLLAYSLVGLEPARLLKMSSHYRGYAPMIDTISNLFSENECQLLFIIVHSL